MIWFGTNLVPSQFLNQYLIWPIGLTRSYAALSLQPASVDHNEGNKQMIDQLDPNWQASMSIAQERHVVMLNHGLLSDVFFNVGPGSSLRIPAHKYMLAAGSSVFFAMFYGELAVEKNEIDIPDMEPQAFRNLLK